MATESENLESLVNRRYEHGFVTEIETETLPPGLNEGVVRAISARKNEPEWLLEWRLQAYRQWLEMDEPEWAHLHYPKIKYDEISYFAAPKSDDDRPKTTQGVGDSHRRNTPESISPASAASSRASSSARFLAGELSVRGR